MELDPYYHPATQALSEITMEYGNQLPKEDKDSDYIKKVAVKLEPTSETNPKQVKQNKPQEKQSDEKAIRKETDSTPVQTAEIQKEEQPPVANAFDEEKTTKK